MRPTLKLLSATLISMCLGAGAVMAASSASGQPAETSAASAAQAKQAALQKRKKAAAQQKAAKAKAAQAKAAQAKAAKAKAAKAENGTGYSDEANKGLDRASKYAPDAIARVRKNNDIDGYAEGTTKAKGGGWRSIARKYIGD